MSDHSLFTVEDPAELLALWRLVAEAKFHAAPNDPELWGSCYVHALAQRISDSLLQHYMEQGSTQFITMHQEWVASLPSNSVLPVVKAKIKKDASTGWWAKQSHVQRLAYVRDCVAPFQPTIEFLESLVREAEA